MVDLLERIARANPEYVEELYRRHREDPQSVDREWALLFAGYQFGLRARRDGTREGPTNPPGVLDLVHSYRELGHLIADSDPLGRRPRRHPLLELEEFGLREEDLEREVTTPFRGMEVVDLGELVEALQETYCSTLGVEFMHIMDRERREWLLGRMEPARNRPDLTPEDRRRMLKQLVTAQGFERFLHTKFRGAKRFSLEGGETLIPLLDTIVEQAGTQGVEEIVFGMPHRGRLNVLAHVLHKPYELILAEFEGLEENEDVKYHLGYANDHITCAGHKMHLALSANPSHLESVDPVILGMVRAKQEALGGLDARRRVIPVLMHGDAAFTGQGIVYETLELSGLEGFTTGGTLHIIINNQLGFTTDPEEARSTTYATDIAKILQAPVFHVNADDPEAVVWAAELAHEYRQTFGSDVFIDLVCYRRYGHNELDDPTFTQPEMYALVKNHPSVVELYEERLAEEGVVEAGEAGRLHDELRNLLEEKLECARNAECFDRDERPLRGLWEGLAGADWGARTRVPADTLHEIADALGRFPDDFTPHRRIPKLFEQMRELVHEGERLHWAAGENLAYGTLLLEGVPVRLTGQDSARGTFSHRHAVLYDAETGEPYVPLNHLSEGQARMEVINSPLSELAVLGFEVGISSADPRRLVIWEAQYGDFSNGAQVIIDQFIASGEAKWGRQSGLVMLLPHGYEGQGPEHSSARPERFLQLCAQENIQVVNPTTPAQFFHALRRQMHRDFRKPLVVLTPKSLLRHKRAVSRLSDFTERDFQTVLSDPVKPSHVRRVLLCSGKVYYTLEAAREERGLEDEVALIRLEQYYPFPEDELREALAPYREIRDLCWVQEEPQNQGAWSFLLPRLPDVLHGDQELRYIGRPASASPATGSYQTHQQEEERFVSEAFARLEDSQERVKARGREEVKQKRKQRA